MIIIIMGVSGCGKTTVGALLSKKLNLPFFDADDFHPDVNIHKMSNGIPLTDTDRQPWLETLSKELVTWQLSGGAILACSALKESYRQILNSNLQKVEWVFLNAGFELLLKRLQERNNHYMKPSLLQSQFDTLEIPNYGLHLNVELDVKTLVTDILNNIKRNE